MSLPVFYLPELSSYLGDAALGDAALVDAALGDAAQQGPQQVPLDGAEGKHAVTVKRIGVGEHIEVVDGRGVRAELKVAEVVGKDRLLGDVVHVTAERPARPKVTVVQALPKAERSELAIDLATQAGADAFVPWQSERAVAKWAGAKVAKGVAKWEAAALASAKQSRRAWVPKVKEPVDTAGLIAWLGEQDATVLMLHEDAAEPIASAELDVDHVVLIVGPEGGIGKEEAAQLHEAGARPTKLGPEVVRTASAAMVALAAIGVLAGRW